MALECIACGAPAFITVKRGGVEAALCSSHLEGLEMPKITVTIPART